MKLGKKTAIVTGGSSGFGKAIIDMLLNNGSQVVNLDISENGFVNSPDLLNIKCDITKEDELINAMNKIKKNFAKINILINNAGIIHSELLVNITSDKRKHSIKNWQKIIDINLTAPFMLTSFVTEEMIMNRTKGVVINISSISAKGNVGQSAYSASKAGLESMSKVWAKELGSFGIRSVAIAPGFVNTDSTFEAMDKTRLDEIKKEVPLKRLGKVDDIVKAVQFVIEHDYFNGKVLEVDGGLVL